MSFESPVAFFIFNRPRETRLSFEAIAAARPSRLYIIADGPRPDHPEDIENCERSRAAVLEPKWPCCVRRNFSDSNLGLADRTITGKDWVFSEEERVIFVEDDNIVDISFFEFCDEMLRKYADDERVAAVTGTNLLAHRAASGKSYFFSTIFNSWTHGMWKRSWSGFDRYMTFWPEVRERKLLKNVFTQHAHFRYWESIMDSVYRGRYDSWGYPYMLCCWLQSALTIVPAHNLVANVGFGARATHTKVDQGWSKELGGIDFPLRHPDFVIADRAYDDAVCDSLVRQASLRRKIASRLRRVTSGWMARPSAVVSR